MLKVEMKLEGSGANGGIQYRSLNVPPMHREIPADRLAQMTDEQKQRMQQNEQLLQKHAKWNLQGYQADFDYNNRYTGQLYEQDSDRGIIAWRGQMVATEPGRSPACSPRWAIPTISKPSSNRANGIRSRSSPMAIPSFTL